MKYCSKCLAPDTRPRITFDGDGVCNACRHAENKKKSIGWEQRWKKLHDICDKYRSKGGSFDCIVPCSGGKDGAVVAWKLKHELGMHPLCITLAPQLATEIGKKNLENFICSGFDHILITADPEKEKKIAKFGFVEYGQPKLPALIGQTTAMLNMAIKLDISIQVWGEEGESEYGGVSYLAEKTSFTKEDRIKIYFNGIDPDDVAEKAGLTRKDMVWWEFPEDKLVQELGIACLYWSYFEEWDPYEHYLFAKAHAGFQTLPARSIATYTNYAQLDDDLQDLHAYCMFLKFGFGRATSDACIDVRRGAMDRKQALALVKRYDWEYPEALIPRFLDYFEMTKQEFYHVIDKLANKEVLQKTNGIWRLKYEPC
jgi:N-acetyl sugar amidotransferase